MLHEASGHSGPHTSTGHPQRVHVVAGGAKAPPFPAGQEGQRLEELADDLWCADQDASAYSVQAASDGPCMTPPRLNKLVKNATPNQSMSADCSANVNQR